MGVPMFIIYLTSKSARAKKVGAVVITYIVGLIFGNIGILPRSSTELTQILAGQNGVSEDILFPFLEKGIINTSDLLTNQILILQDTLMSISIMLAIPMILFSLDIKRWLKQARKALFSLFLGIISLLIVIFIGYQIFNNDISESWKITGMLAGIYTGGTPNLSAISTALDVEPNIFILVNTYDIIIGAVILLFILTYAQKIFKLFLPKFKYSNHKSDLVKRETDPDYEDFNGMLTKEGIIHSVKTLMLSILILGIAFGLSFLTDRETTQMVIIVLTVTTLGIIASLFKSVNKIEKSFQLGMYFITVFSLVIASMSDLNQIINIEYLFLFLFVLVAVVGSMLVHVFLSWVFKVDTDTTIITITALTYSTPFVPVVAGTLKNKEVIVSGLTIGILGYAFGNYLGIGIAYFIQGL